MKLFNLSIAVLVLAVSTAHACPGGGGQGRGWNPGMAGNMGKGNMGGGFCRHQNNTPPEAVMELNPVEFTRKSVASGARVYAENCSRCHGLYGMGDGPDAASLPVRPAMMMRASHHNSDGGLAHVIRNGRDPMPAFQGKLEDDQIWDVINYIRYEFGRGHGGMGHNRAHGGKGQQRSCASMQNASRL